LFEVSFPFLRSCIFLCSFGEPLFTGTHMKKIFVLIAALLVMFTADMAHSQLLPPDTTTYFGTGQSGNVVHFRRPPDSLMVPGKLMILFRHGALDSGLLSSRYEYFYHPPKTKGKGNYEPLGGPTYGSPSDQRGFPDALRSALFADRFYLDSSNNIVNNSGLAAFMRSNGGHWLHRLTTASPVDTLSVTRIGDTIGCNHSDWMLLAMDSTHNPLVLAYLLTTLFRHDVLVASPDYRGGVLCGHLGDTAADTKYLSCQRNTNMINAEAAWWYEVGDPSIIVGVADGGVDYRHPDFGDSVLGVGHKFQVAWNFDVDSGAHYIYDNCPHGTQMAGILGALTNNQSGAPFYDQTVAGIAGGRGSLTTMPMHPVRGRGASIDIAAASIQDGYSPFCASLFEMSARSPNSPYGWGVHTINISEGIPKLFFDISPPHAGINYAFESKVV
jgi:subtilisin family serine protease